jgi:hypothetical protein
MYSSNAGYHGLGRAAGTVNGHHSGKPCPAQPPDRIQTKSRVFPDAGAHTRFGELHDHSGDAADEKGERVLEHAPGDGFGRQKSSLADRSRDIDVRPVAGFKQHPRYRLQAALQWPR